MAAKLEVELKLEVDPADFAALERIDLIRDAPAETNDLVSIYFDTPSCALAEQGIALRVRREGSRWVQTVKVAAGPSTGLFSRDEWEQAVPDRVPVIDAAAGPVAELLGEAGTAALAPMFECDFRRSDRRLRIEGADIQLSIDSGVIRAGERTAPIGEVELELRGGDSRGLFDLARRIDGHVPLRLGVRSKSERGYALARGDAEGAVKAEPVRLDPRLSIADSFRRIAFACIRQYRRNEAILLRSESVEAVHQARVALRRLRSAFALYKPVLHGDEQAVALRYALRRLAGDLGAVRDLDVLIARWPGVAPDALIAARSQAWEHLRAALESARARLLMIDLAEWLSLGDWACRPADPRAAGGDLTVFASEALERCRRRLNRAGRNFADLDKAGRHRARIAAKKLRYAAEFLGSLFEGRKTRRRRERFFARIEALQDRLGLLQDFETARHLMDGLAIDARHVFPLDVARQRDHAERCHRALMEEEPFWR